MKKKCYLGKTRKIYTSSFCSKVFTPWLLMRVFFLLEHQWAFESSVIVANEFLSCPQCEKFDLKTIQSMLGRVQYIKMLENQRICGTWRIFLKNNRQLNSSGQTRDSWTTITKQKHTAVDHSGNNTIESSICKLLNGVIFLKSNYYFLLWTTCKHILCQI